MRFRLGEVQTFVSDLRRAREFYRDVLGLTLCAESAGWLVFDIAGTALVLVPGATPVPRDKRYSAECATVVCLQTEEIDGERKRLEGQGVRFLTRTKDVPQGRFAAFQDPDGNLLELVEKRSKNRSV